MTTALHHGALAETAPASAARPRMRILYFNYEWDLGESSGASTHITQLTDGLRALGHTVTVCDRHRAPDDGPGGVGDPRRPRWTPALRRQLSPYLHESAALIRSVRGIRTETSLIRREQPDVVLTRCSLHQFSSLLAAHRCGVPIVFEVNAPVGFEYRRYNREYHLLPRFAEWSEARTFSSADGVFVVSSALKAHLVERGVPAASIRVIPNGADTTRFRPDAANAVLRARLGPDRTILGFVGSFGSFHGIEMLRHAITTVVPKRPDVAFLLVGKGRLSGELEAYCRTRGFADRVLFAGFVPHAEVPGAVAAMDIVLAPYAPQELFYFSPIKLFEYMAAGRAVLAADLGQIAEVIEDGRNGMLYDPGNARAFEEKLLQLVDDHALRTRLGVNARRTIEQQYTWRMNAERVADLLANVVLSRGRAAPGRAAAQGRDVQG
jgi:glycosyltransferase involved in cell wall biosynthesis